MCPHARGHKAKTFMKIPETIKIGSKEWKIELDDEVREDGAYGKCFPSLSKIYLYKRQEQKEIEITLIHELLHACASFVGIKDHDKLTEEEFINRVSQILHTVLEENELF